jgi:hypothetical protein
MRCEKVTVSQRGQRYRVDDKPRLLSAGPPVLDDRDNWTTRRSGAGFGARRSTHVNKDYPQRETGGFQDQQATVGQVLDMRTRRDNWRLGV